MRVVVIGGGIAGLAAAHELRALGGPGLEIVVVEGADRLGGKLRTTEIAGETVEAGAETFLMRDRGQESAVLRLARRVGLGDELVHPAPVPAAIAVDRRLPTIPAGTLLGVPSNLSTLDGLARVSDEDRDEGRPLLDAGEDVGVGALVRRRLGDEVVDRLVDPMLGGVYAGRADALSLAATMPGLHAAAHKEHTLTAAVRAALAAAPRPSGEPVFAAVHGGLSRLVDVVAKASGAAVRLRTTVRELLRTPEGWRIVVGSTRDARVVDADAVVLAVPAAPAARLLDIESIVDYASVALVTFAFPPATRLPDLSGFLVPAAERPATERPAAERRATEGYAVKAATFFSTKWRRPPDAPVLVRASVGRYGEERVLQRLDDDLIDLVHAELGTLVGATLPAPLAATVTRWGGGLPQYGVGHVDRVVRLRADLPPMLAVAGAAYDGVGIAACVQSGEAAARAVWTSIRASDIDKEQ